MEDALVRGVEAGRYSERGAGNGRKVSTLQKNTARLMPLLCERQKRR